MVQSSGNLKLIDKNVLDFSMEASEKYVLQTIYSKTGNDTSKFKNHFIQVKRTMDQVCHMSANSKNLSIINFHFA
jgi:hypothetical protein